MIETSPPGRSAKGTDGRSQRRKIEYPRFDAGSRADFNSTRLQQNAGSFGLAVAKTQRHIARLKTREAYHAARIRDSEPVGTTSEDRALVWERTLHACQRAAQVQWLITELDQLFFELLGLRENQLVRQTVWSNRFPAPGFHAHSRRRSFAPR